MLKEGISQPFTHEESDNGNWTYTLTYYEWGKPVRSKKIDNIINPENRWNEIVKKFKNSSYHYMILDEYMLVVDIDTRKDEYIVVRFDLEKEKFEPNV